jgi:tetratricopeptide (TPR) repeat protein
MRVARIASFACSLAAASPVFAQIERCSQADAAFDAENYGLAVTHYSTCLTAKLTLASRARALMFRAQAYGQLKQFDSALSDQRDALSIEAPRNVWPLVMLSVYYRGLKDYESALAALRAAMKLDEDGPGTGPGMAVHYHTGQTLHAMGRFKEAVESYTLGIPKQPDYGYALYRRALAYEALGDRDMAKRDLFRAAELEPREGYEADVAAKLKEYGFAVRKVRNERLD